MQEPTRKILSRPSKSRTPVSGSGATSRPVSANKTSQRPVREAKEAPKPPIEINTLEIKADSLAFSLIGAAHAVSYVLEGTALPQALSRVFAQTNASPQARGAIQDIAYRTMRQVGRADALLTLMTNKAPEPPLLYSLLCCALSVLIYEDPALAPYEDFVVVDQAVNAAASSSHMVFAKGMVNAVLRRFLREKTELIAMVVKQPAGLWNYPQWWVDQCKTAYPQEWQNILQVGNTPPPMSLRVNQRQISVPDYLALLAEKDIQATQIGSSAVRLSKPLPVQNIPGFEQGLVSVQDAGAQLAAPLLNLHDGMRVLDACAAPGGKTGHLLELSNVDLVAIDADPKRVERIHENLARLKLFATIKAGDAGRTDWWDGQLFDRILADVPCTASGVVRRHPDIRWLRRKTDVAQLAASSARILDNLWRMLKPGGQLLLVTCSIWPLESELQASSFALRSGAIRLDAPGQLLPTSEMNNEHDGLFYALFQKPAA